MKILFIILFPAILFLSSCGPTSDYREMHRGMDESDEIRFFADPLVFYDSAASMPRLDLSLDIPVSGISFRKNYENNTYFSKINISVNIKNSKGEVVLSKSYEEKSLYSYEEIKSKAKESRFYIYSYFLSPDNYKLELELKDDYIGNYTKKSFTINVPDFSVNEISVSDLMLLSKIELNADGTREITPLINNNIFGINELDVFFEIYNNSLRVAAKDYSLKLMSEEGELIKESSFHYELLQGKNQKFESVLTGKVIMKHLEKEPDQDMSMPGPLKKYSFKLELSDVESGKIIARKKLQFYPIRLMPGTMNRPPQR